MKDVFIFGAGPNGQRFINTIGDGFLIKGFIDSDPQKTGSVVAGHVVYAPSHLHNLDPAHTLVFVASQAWHAISSMLEGYGFLVGIQVFNGLALLGEHPVQQRHQDDATFMALVQQVRPYTLLDDMRLYMLYQLARLCVPLDGAFAEAGVYRGGSAKLLQTVAAGHTCYFFDTFNGLPDVTMPVDFHQHGDFADTSLAQVQALLQECEDVHLVDGLFPDSARDLVATFAFVHVDFDLYRSVLDACAYFWPQLVAGGMMLFDDYGYASCPGVAQALTAYFGEAHPGVYLPTGQLLMIKRSV